MLACCHSLPPLEHCPENLIITLVDRAAYDLGATTSSTVTIPRNDTVVTNTDDGGDGSLRQAVDNAVTFGSGTVTFSSVSAPISLASPIGIIGSITIDGANTVTVSASGFRAFTITGGTVILKDFTIQGGGVDVMGGNVTIGNDPLYIIGNSAALGGGIYTAGTSVTVQTRASVSDNLAGGGIYQQAGDLNIIDSFIQQNTGGAIRFAASGVRSVTGTCIVLNSDTAAASMRRITGGDR